MDNIYIKLKGEWKYLYIEGSSTNSLSAKHSHKHHGDHLRHSRNGMSVVQEAR